MKASKRKLWHVSTSMLLVLAMGLVMVLSGCGGKNNGGDSQASQSTNPATVEPTSGGSSPTPEQPEEKTKISMMVVLNGSEGAPDKDGPFQTELEKLTNTELDINWVPSPVYFDKLSVAISADKLPDITMPTNMKEGAILNAIRNGVFWEIGPYLKDYPNLNQFSPAVLANASVDGKLYGLPRLRQLSRVGVVYRKDWADKLNLQPPASMEDVRNMAEAFVKNDPDKTGNTGLADTSSLLIDTAFPPSPEIYFGGPNKWGVKDGIVTPSFMYDEYFAAMKWFKDMYDHGYMNKDFALTNANQRMELLNKGKAGLMLGNTSDVNKMTALLAEKQAKDPNVKLEDFMGISVFKDAGGNYAPTAAGDGYYGEILINKKTVKTEEQLRKILAFFDKISSEEGQNLFYWGIDGVHYEMVDGKRARTDATNAMYKKEISNFLSVGVFQQDFTSAANKVTLGAMSGFAGLEIELHKELAKVAIPNVTAPFLSETYTKEGAELSKIWQDGVFQFIMGNIDEKGWNDLKDQWLKRGGQKIIDEYTAAYNQAQSSK